MYMYKSASVWIFSHLSYTLHVIWNQFCQPFDFRLNINLAGCSQPFLLKAGGEVFILSVRMKTVCIQSGCANRHLFLHSIWQQVDS